MFDLHLWRDTLAGNMFALPEAVSVAEKILRPIIVYAVLVVLLRVFGKRELAQLNPFDLVVLLSLSNTVQNAIIGDETSVTGGVIGAVTLLSVNYLVVRGVFKHRRLDQILEGSPTVLIEKGRVRDRALAKEMLTRAELQAVAHRQGYAHLEDIESCTLEPGGTFFIQGKHAAPENESHAQLLARLDAITRQLEELRQGLREGTA